MHYNVIYNILRRSPNILRKPLYLIPIEYRLGGSTFIETYNFLKETEKWSKEKLQEYQAKQLQCLLEHAVKHVPFYSGIKPTSRNPFKNLESFPIIDKETIQQDISKFRANNIPEKATYYVTTGGTSGNPLGFYLDNSTFGKEWAFVTTGWRRVGFTPGDKVVSFRGVEFRGADKGRYWQDNPVYNMLEMSPFHMSEANLQKYVNKIIKFKPKYIHGYPSAVSILANYVKMEANEFPPIKAVLAISENIYPGQRELIETAFNARLFSFYGMSEKVIMAPECEYDTRYHAFPEYGVTELVDNEGNPVNEGGHGELIGTGFLNYCMPFIRYLTGDYAKLSDKKCKCGRNHLLLKDLIGRWRQEMVVGMDGALISIAALNLHSDVMKNVNTFQFKQIEKGEIIVKLVPKEKFDEKDEYIIIKSLRSKVGDNLIITTDIVNKMELTSRGKHKLLVQELKE